MALGILSEDKGTGLAVLYNTVTMTSFGPVMPCAMWAEAFVKHLGIDPRTMEAQAVSDKWDEFAFAHEECTRCGVAIALKGEQCEECSE